MSYRYFAFYVSLTLFSLCEYDLPDYVVILYYFIFYFRCISLTFSSTKNSSVICSKFMIHVC